MVIPCLFHLSFCLDEPKEPKGQGKLGVFLVQLVGEGEVKERKANNIGDLSTALVPLLFSLFPAHDVKG